ncbi:MAG: hypothetical protein QOD38_4, partial [Acidimicrobiaceae bacterium]
MVALFAVLWAAANLFHVWGPSGRAFELFSGSTTLGLVQAAAGVVAVAVLLRPRSIALLAALAALGPVMLWFEAPVAGSHWVLASLVDLALLLAMIAARWGDRLAPAFVPVARLVLIGFYFFAAFAKLNHAFFTPSVSCGTYYFDELAGSLGISLHSASGGWWSHLVLIGVAATETSIPILLCFRRTRYAGVAVGLVFHSLIALDQTHLFSDFSSVLLALFVLFLPASFASDVMGRHRERVRAAVAAVAAMLLLLQWTRGNTRLYRDGLGWAWVLFDVVVLALVARFLLRPHPPAVERPFSFRRHGV